MTFNDILVGQSFAVLVVFSRLGAALMLLPGFGESHVPPRLRLWLALFTSALLAAALGERLPGPPVDAAALAALIGIEVLIGLAIGSILRLTLAALHFAGSLVALQSGLAAAAFFDPSEATAGTVPGALLSTLFLVVLFTGDGHHLVLERVVSGYAAVPPGLPLDTTDLLDLVVRVSSAALAVGSGIAAPVLLVSFLANVALGALARLVPSLQVLFVALPVQLLLALSALALALGGAMAVGSSLLDRSSVWLLD